LVELLSAGVSFAVDGLLSLAPPNKSLPVSLGLDGAPNRSSAGAACGGIAGFSVAFGVLVLARSLPVDGTAAFVGPCGGSEGAGVVSIGLLTVDGIILLLEAPLGAAGCMGTGGVVIGRPAGGCGAMVGCDVWPAP
jgi:hypothetical protein